MDSTQESRWQAVLTRDVASDGAFLYGVLSTGVYCRPSCPSRRPLRKNVRFYADAAQAERDGLRACKRCCVPASDDAMAHKVERACRYIEAHASDNVQLSALSRHVGLSRFHLQRRFKAIVGMTPRQYAEACRLATFKRELREGASVTAATYSAGFGSSSRIYERVGTRLGMTPSQYRKRGRGVEISYVVSKSPIGTLLIAATDRGLCAVKIGDGEPQLVEELEREFPEATMAETIAPGGKALQGWMHALAEYLEGGSRSLALPLDIHGTAFQMKVWTYLMQIPHGEVRSYAEVASAIGRPGAARAVGSACGANPVALAVPCHRVIRGDGALGGYRWGLARKRALIDQERATRDRRSARS